MHIHVNRQIHSNIRACTAARLVHIVDSKYKCARPGGMHITKKTITTKNKQDAPAISIQGSFVSGVVSQALPLAAMDGPISTSCTVDLPLKIIPADQLLCHYKIGQTVSTPGVFEIVDGSASLNLFCDLEILLFLPFLS